MIPKRKKVELVIALKNDLLKNGTKKYLNPKFINDENQVSAVPPNQSVSKIDQKLTPTVNIPTVSNLSITVMNEGKKKIKMNNGKIFCDIVDKKNSNQTSEVKELNTEKITSKIENIIPTEKIDLCNFKKCERIPILNLSIVIDEEKKGQIIIYKGQKPVDIATKFVMDNSLINLDLSINLVEKLSEMISSKIAKLSTKIDEVDESEENSDH